MDIAVKVALYKNAFIIIIIPFHHALSCAFIPLTQFRRMCTGLCIHGNKSACEISQKVKSLYSDELSQRVKYRKRINITKSKEYVLRWISPNFVDRLGSKGHKLQCVDEHAQLHQRRHVFYSCGWVRRWESGGCINGPRPKAICLRKDVRHFIIARHFCAVGCMMCNNGNDFLFLLFFF